MNVTDLTTELQARAADPAGPTGVPAVSRLSGVRQRIRTRRRRQAGTVAGIAALSVAAVVLAPGLSGAWTDRSSARVTTASPSDPLVFAADVAGDPLVASGLGAPGQQDLVVRFTPTAANIAISTYCRVPGSEDEDTATIALTVNGHSLSQGDCSPDDGPNQDVVSRGDDPEVSRAAWKLNGLKVGQETAFRLRVTDPQPGFDPAGVVRLGVGIYELSAPRRVVDGIRFPTLLDHDGHRYHLVGLATGELATGTAGSAANRRLDLTIPAGRYPAQVLWGVTSTDPEQEPKGAAQLLIDGKPGPTGADIGIVATDTLPDAGAHRVRLQAERGSRGAMQMAYYVRKD